MRGFVSRALGPIITGPTRAILNFMQMRMGGVSTADNFMVISGKLALYTTLVFGFKGLQRLFFAVPHETFLKKSGLKLKSDPKSVLFLDFIGAKDKLAGYADATFNRLYADHADAHFVQFEDLAQLKQALEVYRGKSFDRIEIMVHGQPGSVVAKDKNGVKVSGEDITRAISELGFSLSHSETELRLISCSLLNGQGTGRDNYDSRLKEFISAILPAGGTAVGVSKNILTFEMAPDPKGYQRGDSQWLDSGMIFLSYMLNTEVARTILYSASSINRNYLDALNDVVVLTIDQNGHMTRVGK